MNSKQNSGLIRILLAFGLGAAILGLGYLGLIYWLKPGQSKPLPVTGRQVSTSEPQITNGTPESVSLPIRAAFYYPWFPEAWSQSNYDPFTNYLPVLGYYNSSDSATIKKHIDEMLYGNITAGIASWWGPGSDTDKRIPALLAAAQGTGFHWALYYEMNANPTVSVSQLHSDLAYVQQHYGNDPSYLRIDGRFVVFVYYSGQSKCDLAQQWVQANQGINAYLVLKVMSGYKSCPAQPDGWHQYAPGKDADRQGDYSFTISPGFWKMGSSPQLTRDISRWAQDVRDMIASGARFQLITSFNEWGEGTAVEPASVWQTSSGYGAFLDVLHDNGQGTLPKLGPVEQNAAQQRASAPSGSQAQLSSGVTNPSSSSPQTLPTPMPSFLPPGATGDPVLLAAGDISSCASKGDLATAKILTDYPDAVIATLGDTVYEQGSPEQFANCFNPAWGAFKNRIHPAVGNHEYLTSEAAGYFGYFGFAAGDPTKGYYSYDLGSWHVVVINSNCSQVGGCGKGSPQETWLKADLAAHPAKCTLAYWHHPRWSSGEHGDQIQVQTIWADLFNAGADLVLSGHDHDYERFAPLDANGNPDPTTGIREFVVGTGGKNYYPFGSTTQPGSEVRKDNDFGILKLTLHADSYDWQFISQAGQNFTDSGSGQCH